MKCRGRGSWRFYTEGELLRQRGVHASVACTPATTHPCLRSWMTEQNACDTGASLFLVILLLMTRHAGADDIFTPLRGCQEPQRSGLGVHP